MTEWECEDAPRFFSGPTPGCLPVMNKGNLHLFRQKTSKYQCLVRRTASKEDACLSALLVGPPGQLVGRAWKRMLLVAESRAALGTGPRRRFQLLRDSCDLPGQGREGRRSPRPGRIQRWPLGHFQQTLGSSRLPGWSPAAGAHQWPTCAPPGLHCGSSCCPEQPREAAMRRQSR